MADTAETKTPAAAPKVKKTPKAKKAVTHPSYNSMIKDAITALKERGGSSRQAITKYVSKNYKVSVEDKNVNAQLKMALKRGVAKGDLKQSKGKGASGSFKLGVADTEKKPKAKKVTKPKVKKAKSPKKVTKPVKKVAAKKVKKPKAAKPAKKVAKSPKKVKKAPAKKAATKPKKAKTPKKATHKKK